MAAICTVNCHFVFLTLTHVLIYRHHRVYKSFSIFFHVKKFDIGFAFLLLPFFLLNGLRISHSTPFLKMEHPRGPFVNCSYMDFNFLSTRWTFARRYYMRKRLLYSTFLMPHRFVFTQSLLCPYDMRNFTPIVKPMKKHRKPDKKANKRHL